MSFSNAPPLLHGTKEHQEEGGRSYTSTSTSMPKDPFSHDEALSPLESANAKGSQLGVALKCGESSFVRRTVRNRVLRYFLKVHQQPAGARTCESGPKGSGYLYRIDPAPIISLRIFDQTDDVHADITVSYDATFFLMATLQCAIPVARADGSQGAPLSAAAVLLGSPVAGANYLNFPYEAIWFILPDLDIRHEGLYRLSFHLYETSKNPDDCDPGAFDAALQLRGESDTQPVRPCNEIRWRMEVNSAAFRVYSSVENWPGLRAGTALSMTLAEQGVRVRIRREVRIRAHDSKGNGDYDDFEQEYTRLRSTPPLESDRGFYIRDERTGSATEKQPYSQDVANMGAEAMQEVPMPMGTSEVPRLSEPPFELGDIWGFQPGAFKRQPSSRVINAGSKSPILPPTPTIKPGSREFIRITESLIRAETEVDLVNAHSTVWKESIWSTFVESLRFMVGADYHTWPSHGIPIPPEDGEPRSHATKRASEGWWLAHPSEPWRTFCPRVALPAQSTYFPSYFRAGVKIS